MSQDLIPCSYAVREGVALGLTVAEACEVLRDGLCIIQRPLWAQQSHLLYATPENLKRRSPSDTASELSPVLLTKWDLPVANDEGFGVILDDETESTAAVVFWLEDLLQFRSGTELTPGSTTASDLHYHRERALSRLRATAERLGRKRAVMAGRGGRPPLIDYEACTAAVFSQIAASPHLFQGADGRILQHSDMPHQQSVVRAAREWCELQRPDHEPPSNDTLRKKVADRLCAKLGELGLSTWKDGGSGKTVSPVLPR